MAITTLNNRSINRSDTASADQVWTATSATASDFQAAAAGGKILQVVQATKTDTATIASASFTDLGFSAAITPSATTSKVFVLFSMMLSSEGGERAGIKLVRNSTDLLIGDTAGSRQRATHSVMSSGSALAVPTVVSYLNSPSTTSETTYKIQAFCENSNNFNINTTETDADSASYSRGASSVILMEVSV